MSRYSFNPQTQVDTPTTGEYNRMTDGYLFNSSRGSALIRNTESGRPSGRSSVIFDLVAVPDVDENMGPIMTHGEVEINSRPKKKYKGRLKMWPGIIILVLCSAAAVFCVIYYADKVHEAMTGRTHDKRIIRKRIDDGTEINIPDDEGFDEPGNPKKYPNRNCAHLNYLSKKHSIYAVTPNGKEIRIPIKGINWSGMETSHGIPYGLWDNLYNGTTVYQVASFLARNKFNAVRLPLSVENILKNIKPNHLFINKATNQAIDSRTYRNLLKGIIEALGYRGIAVLLDIHTLTPTETGELWYSEHVPEKDVLKAIDILGKDLCSEKYWNIFGLDLKNEPAKAKWGSGNPKNDWRLGAEKLGNQMLKACSKWTAHIEGITGTDSISLFGTKYFYHNWWGGGLQKASEFPIRLKEKDKIVWSPHYYSPSVYPARYFYAGGRGVGGTYHDFIERSEKDLITVVEKTMYQMFGYLIDKGDSAIILGEFGGLYGTDKHPKKTTKRVIDNIMKTTVDPKNKYGGGFVWCLNPESGYEFNPASKEGHWQYGLLKDDWLRVNKEYLEGLKVFDEMEGLQQFPCIQE